MALDINLHLIQEGAQSSEALAAINSALLTLLARTEQIMSALTDLQNTVRAQQTVVGSAVTLLQGLKNQIDGMIANGATEDQLRALSADLSANTQSLAQAVVTNTPQATDPNTPTPTPGPDVNDPNAPHTPAEPPVVNPPNPNPDPNANGGSVVNPDGTITNPDGSVTNPDGTVTPAPVPPAAPDETVNNNGQV